ncbi:hypothetical protein DP107_14490 [Haloglomus irregulare]|jgi:hypothetical protein|uniref:Uncharacterized protein n=1 Tax=Haloglomus irregulare TaxID=2234134 RepID=A0A554MYJ8_9EURY|nr:hypothetical protein [Haloglomus irregulare]TSD09850.1 hypothetical protein DP107_14490 [Haloglomus irregulare]
MAEDQATLSTFDDEAGPDDGAVTGDRPASTDGRAGGAAGEELVCPWCLAGADRFVEAGPTGLGCGRCSAALPVDADWFHARDVVAPRPMYETAD